MPADKKRSNGRTASKPPVSDSQVPVSKINSDNGGDNQIATNQTNHRETEKIKPQAISIVHIPKIDVTEGIQANKIAKTSNIISGIAVFVSTLLFAGTLFLVDQAIKQSNAASDSVALARQTYLADSTYKHKNDSISKISDSIKNAREDSVFRLQIEALNTTRNQFEKINTPFITIKNATIGTVDGGFIGIGYDYYSATGNAVQMVEINDTLVYIPINGDAKFRKHPFSYIGFKYSHFKISDYLTKDSANRQRVYPSIDAKDILSKVALKQGKIYFLVNDIYKNSINGKRRIFVCVIECHPLPQDVHRSSYNIIYQKNEYTK